MTLLVYSIMHFLSLVADLEPFRCTLSASDWGAVRVLVLYMVSHKET